MVMLASEPEPTGSDGEDECRIKPGILFFLRVFVSSWFIIFFTAEARRRGGKGAAVIPGLTRNPFAACVFMMDAGLRRHDGGGAWNMWCWRMAAAAWFCRGWGCAVVLCYG